ncbi:DJ-1 family glyoxalase III [sulfur-oxidizing endosymbiont of Gigantopelta aegis]|uniref:DJ-1 family glyoxalase III n=1 Tax=sulfur-oxidizing endosymbiont of Gigantopelta aegis TaxID=2794934 RepID=UPI0018DE89E4|nr:DJ-1 family glyoxalase III [sulfur-oxidizing endosymbiont of Gigantopelta aegis]
MPHVLVPLAPGCEELEAITIIDLLRRAEIQVSSASLDTGDSVSPVTASRGVVLIPDITLDQALQQSFDMIVLPGGLPGADHLDNDARIHTLLQSMSADNKYTAAICAAPKVLARAKLLDGKSATSYPGVLDTMDLNSTRLSTDAVVIDGNVITSRGPATAMDFALTLIELLSGKSKRDEAASALLCS